MVIAMVIFGICYPSELQPFLNDEGDTSNETL
jgi:hypothetical protein